MKRIFCNKLFTLTSVLAVVFTMAVFSACSEKEDAPFIKSADAGTTITAVGTSWAGLS